MCTPPPPLPFIPPILSSRFTEEHTRTCSLERLSPLVYINTLLIKDTDEPNEPCVYVGTLCARVCMCLWPSVGLVGGEQRSVHRLHAGGAGERPHQPVVYTVHVVDVHAGQEPDRVSVNKVHHTNDASAQENTDMADLKFTV